MNIFGEVYILYPDNVLESEPKGFAYNLLAGLNNKFEQFSSSSAGLFKSLGDVMLLELKESHSSSQLGGHKKGSPF